MREEKSPPQEDVRHVPRDLLKPLQQRLVDTPGPELLNQLIVVYRELLSVLRDRALDVPRRHDLLVRVLRGGGFDGWCGLQWLWGNGGRVFGRWGCAWMRSVPNVSDCNY